MAGAAGKQPADPTPPLLAWILLNKEKDPAPAHLVTRYARISRPSLASNDPAVMQKIKDLAARGLCVASTNRGHDLKLGVVYKGQVYPPIVPPHACPGEPEDMIPLPRSLLPQQDVLATAFQWWDWRAGKGTVTGAAAKSFPDRQLLPWRSVTNRHMLYWTTGSGKTSGVGAIVDANPPDRVVIVTPHSVFHEWASEMMRGNPAPGSTTVVDIMAPSTVRDMSKTSEDKTQIKGVDFMKGAVMVWDEVHDTFRNGDAHASTQDMIEMIDATRFALVLTGTPVQKTGSEMLNIIDMLGYPPARDHKAILAFNRLVGIEDPDQKSEAVARFIDQHARDIGPLVTFFSPGKGGQESSYPTIKNQMREVEMDWVVPFGGEGSGGDVFSYLYWTPTTRVMNGFKVRTSIRNAFNVREKMVLNSGEKRAAIATDVVSRLNHGKHGIVVYSWLVGEGVDVIGKSIMKKRPKTTMESITGQTTKEQREDYTKRFNAGNLDVLLISDAGSEGVNLINGDSIYIAEPHKSPGAERQTTTRIVRYGSHPAGASVDQVKFISVFPKGKVTTEIARKMRKRFAQEYRVPEDDIGTVAEVKRDIEQKLQKLGHRTEDQNQEQRNAHNAKLVRMVLEPLERASEPQWRVLHRYVQQQGTVRSSHLARADALWSLLQNLRGRCQKKRREEMLIMFHKVMKSADELGISIPKKLTRDEIKEAEQAERKRSREAKEKEKEAARKKREDAKAKREQEKERKRQDKAMREQERERKRQEKAKREQEKERKRQEKEKNKASREAGRKKKQSGPRRTKHGKKPTGKAAGT